MPEAFISLSPVGQYIMCLQILPQKDFGPEETVKVQLDALRDNDKPW